MWTRKQKSVTVTTEWREPCDKPWRGYTEVELHENLGQVWEKGYRVTYLGHVPAFQSIGQGCTEERVEKILDACNIDESHMVDVYLDIKPYGLIMYYVDEFSHVVDTKLFDIARISYCSGQHPTNSRIFSWIYRQETDTGFQLECHAVKCHNPKRPRILAIHLCEAFNELYVQIQAALKTSEMFSQACKQRSRWKRLGKKRGYADSLEETEELLANVDSNCNTSACLNNKQISPFSPHVEKNTDIIPLQEF